MFGWTFTIGVALAVVCTTQARTLTRNYADEYENEKYADESDSYSENRNGYSYDSSSTTEKLNLERNDATRSPEPSTKASQAEISNGTEAGDFDRSDFQADDPPKITLQVNTRDLTRMAFYGDVKGDMILPEGYGVMYGAGTNNPSLRWPNATIPYLIDSSLDELKNNISRAIDLFKNGTCLRFVPRTNQTNYIYLTKGQGIGRCSSSLGMAGGRQNLNLGDGCEDVGTIIHELCHAVGLYHEHQRSDRDKFLTILLGNVTSGAKEQFDKINPDDETIFTNFDYDSIMLYGDYAFSKEPGLLKTIDALNGKELIEPFDKEDLSPSDRLTLRNLYKCNGTTTNNG